MRADNVRAISTPTTSSAEHKADKTNSETSKPCVMTAVTEQRHSARLRPDGNAASVHHLHTQPTSNKHIKASCG